MTQDVVQRRNRSNVTTLSGQALTSFMEVTLINISLVLINSERVIGLERAAYVILTSLVSTITSVALVLTSPELKREYFNFK